MATLGKDTPQESLEHLGGDFTQIQGIGPAIAERINDLGIHTFNQIAEMTPDMLAAMFVDMIGISPERIKKQDWIGQAGRLAAESAEQLAPASDKNNNNRQHYEVFTVELLLDKDNQVRRTRALHVQSHQESSWAGWESTALYEFMAENAGIQSQQVVETPVSTEIDSSVSEGELELVEEAMAVETVSRLTGELGTEETQLISQGEVNSAWLIKSEQPYYIRVTLDLNEVEYSVDQPLHYMVALFAREFKNGAKRQLGEVEGEFAFSTRFTIDIRGKLLDKGVYRLESLVMLSPPADIARPGDTLIAVSEGKLLHVN